MKYALDLDKFRQGFFEKIKAYITETEVRYSLLNPSLIPNPENHFTEDDIVILEAIEKGKMNPEDMPIELVHKMQRQQKEHETLLEKEKDNPINLELFELSELVEYFKFTEEEFLKLIYPTEDVKSKEPLPES